VNSTGSRIGLGAAIVALFVPLIAGGLWVGGVATSALPAVSAPTDGAGDGTGAGAAAGQNPLAGKSFYADPQSKAAKAAADADADADAETAAGGAAEVFAKIAAQPTGIWIEPGKYPLATVEDEVSTIAETAASKGELPVFVVYGIPDRDCGNQSAGGLSAADYPHWVEAIARALSIRKAVVILEPDALALAPQCGNVDQRVEQLHAAVESLATTRAIVYLDAGHSDWMEASSMAALLSRAGIAQTRGFATNVSNFNGSAAEHAWGESVSALTAGAHYVIDTSRNGRGSNGEWCNPSGRALGVVPAVVTGDGAQDANLWVKPPGESDGTCNGGPAAGDWWGEMAVELADNAGWS
jgi:endoglucanase